MRVRARRAGYTEKLTPEQEYDLAPFDEDRPDDVLTGELEQFTVIDPTAGEITVTLVGGQEADPATIQRLTE